MAVFAIYGLLVAFKAFPRKLKRCLDFTAPDRCGGIAFVGEALVVFSSVTLIAGVMISVYILKADWTRDDTWWIMALKWFWVAFPYVMSLVALIAPSLRINEVMTEYKMEKELGLRDHLAKLREHLEDNDLDVAGRDGLRKDYEFQRSMREDLHRMRTWPYGLSSNLKYLTVFLANLSASTQSVSAWMEKYSRHVAG